MRKALHLLGILDDLDLDWIAAHGTVQNISVGTLLIEEKKPISSVFFVLDGELSVSVGGQDGTRIARLLPGEVVGEISFVDGRPPSASVIAVQDSQVLAVSKEKLSAKLHSDHAFAMRFYRSVATFLADRLHVTVGRFGYGSAQQDVDVDELGDAAMDVIDLGAVRFDNLLKRLQGGSRAARPTLV